MGNYWRYAFHCGSQTRSSFWVKPLRVIAALHKVFQCYSFTMPTSAIAILTYAHYSKSFKNFRSCRGWTRTSGNGCGSPCSTIVWATRPYKLFSSWWDSRTAAFGMRILHRQGTQFDQACYIGPWSALWWLAIPNGGPGLNRTGAHGASIRCSTDWATEPRRGPNLTRTGDIEINSLSF